MFAFDLTPPPYHHLTLCIAGNANYPNPPAWGYSYHLNGLESPSVRVVRGTTYTFRVEAGEQHPLYITDSSVGRGGGKVYAGGPDSGGTPAEPFTLTWTPDATTPDRVFYQCFVHAKLGWEILVSNTPSGSETPSGPASALLSSRWHLPALSLGALAWALVLA